MMCWSELGSEVKEVLEQIPGTREGEGEVEYETTGRAPMLEIRVKRDAVGEIQPSCRRRKPNDCRRIRWADGWNDARAKSPL